MSDKNTPQSMAVHCPTCDSVGVCVPCGFTTFNDPKSGPPERWTLLSCPQGHPLLVLQEGFSDLGFDDDEPYRMYPPQNRRLSEQIPKELRNAHDEARKCFDSKAYTAAVVMCGRTLEGTCEKQGIKERTLQRSLDEMKTRGIIDSHLSEWADTLRGVRNTAAHYNDQDVSRQDASDALAYCEALLDYLYVLKARFEEMKARRKA